MVESASASSVALRQILGYQHQTRAGLVVVELRDEGIEHLVGRERAIGLREIGAVAPVLPGAEEEHLHAIVAAGLMDREHVGILDAAQIDALLRLDRRQRREAVAIDRRAFEIERLRGLLHLGGEFLLHRMALAGEECARLAHQFVVIGGAISPVQGAEQRLIWNSRQGRVRLSNTASEQERIRNARCSAVMVRFTAQTEANGP